MTRGNLFPVLLSHRSKAYTPSFCAATHAIFFFLLQFIINFIFVLYSFALLLLLVYLVFRTHKLVRKGKMLKCAARDLLLYSRLLYYRAQEREQNFLYVPSDSLRTMHFFAWTIFYTTTAI